jgi:hypothetical protein
MVGSFLLVALVSISLLIGAWHEHAAGNRRDARLMAGFGTFAALAALIAAVF